MVEVDKIFAKDYESKVSLIAHTFGKTSSIETK